MEAVAASIINIKMEVAADHHIIEITVILLIITIPQHTRRPYLHFTIRIHPNIIRQIITKRVQANQATQHQFGIVTHHIIVLVITIRVHGQTALPASQKLPLTKVHNFIFL